MRDEISKLHQTLEQWSTAEAEWSHQRRLFQMMTENVSDLIVLLDPQGNRTWNNPAYSHHLGYGPQELAGTYALSEVHPDEKQRAVDTLDRDAGKRRHAPRPNIACSKKTAAGSRSRPRTFPSSMTAARLKPVVLLAADVTEKRKLEEALALAQTTATAAGLVEGMARDFDQILTNVFGNLTIAKNLNGPHNAIAVRLNEMERSLQRARDLIEQMFSITPEARPCRRSAPALEPAVQQAVGEVLRGTMVRAEYLFPRNLPEIDIDEEAFSHAIRNIVTNSRAGDGQGRRALLRGEYPALAILLPARPSAQGRRLYLPAHPGPGHRHLGKSAAARLRALLHHAQRLAGPRPHHRALVHPAHGRHDPHRVDAGRGHDRFRLPARRHR